MSALLTIAAHDLKMALRDRAGIMWMFIFPVVFASFFGMIMGQQGSEPKDAKVSISVLDLDDSALSHTLIDQLRDDRLELTALDPGQERPEGTIRTLVIPSGFETSVKAHEQVSLRLEKEPDTSENAALVAQARIVRAIERVIGGLIRAETPGAAADADAPDLVDVKVRWAGQRQAPPSGFAQSVPGNLTMFVLLVSLTYGAASVSAERSSGVLRRLVTAPVAPREIVAGKILGRFAVAALQGTVLLAVFVVAGRWFDLGLGSRFLDLWLVVLIYSACVAPLGVAFGCWFRDPDRAASIGVIVTMAMAAFGGCWWPLEVVSKPLKTFAMIFPTTWTMRALHGLISFGHGWPEIALPAAVVAGFGVAFAALAVRSLRID